MNYSKGDRVELTQGTRVMGPGCWINIPAGTKGTVSQVKRNVNVALDSFGITLSFPRSYVTK